VSVQPLFPSQDDLQDLYGESPAMQALFSDLQIIAQADGPVLLQGESGTGKERVARALHRASGRAQGPFVAVNCAGIPAELLESEFFGHVSGAFTGAQRQRKGLLQEAHGGTLLLDEIADMPMALQAKLLRALEDGTIRPVGQDTERQVQVRFIAATHRVLADQVAAGLFREDLYYRLNTFTLAVPPLRDRIDDLPGLAHRLLRSLSSAKHQPKLHADTLVVLRRYSFPGNVRELINILEHAVAFSQGDATIRPEHLPQRLQETRTNTTTTSASPLLAQPDPILSLVEVQRQHIQRVLQQFDGNKHQAAKALGIGRRTLYRWLT